jgi:hypothetical protein
MPVPPKNGAVPVAVTKPAPAAEQYLHNAERLLQQVQAHAGPPPPVLPPLRYPMGEPAPAPKPEPPGHVITVVRGATTEKVLIKSDRKPARSGGPHAADAGPTPAPAAASEAQ